MCMLVSGTPHNPPAADKAGCPVLIRDETWQLKRLDTGTIGPIVGKFIVGIWWHVPWVRPVRNGVEVTWAEFLGRDNMDSSTSSAPGGSTP